MHLYPKRTSQVIIGAPYFVNKTQFDSIYTRYWTKQTYTLIRIWDITEMTLPLKFVQMSKNPFSRMKYVARKLMM
jgi:hypothetical protein